MKKRYSKKHSSKLNIILVIAALLALVITVITVSYSWIESANTLNINNNGAEGHKISVNVSNPGVAQITEGNGDEVALSQYIDNIGSLFLAPAKLDASGNLTIKRAGTDNYTAATTNDIGNNYIEFDVPIQVVDPMLVFKVKGSVTNGNSIKTAYYLDKTFSNSVAASEIKADVAEPVAFTASRGEHTLKVRLWNDADTTGYDLLSGVVAFDLTLVPEEPGTQNITLEESKYANVIATYNEAGEDKQILEGQSANVMTGTVITVKAETGLGKLITSGENMQLNGHQFASYSVTPGTMSTPTDFDSGNIRTTTSTYTVGTSDATIKTNTSTDTFRLGGENIDGIQKWSNDVHDSKDMQYNEELNCVYLVIKATEAPTFKIASGENFTKTYRDSQDYTPSITMTSSNIIANGVEGAKITTPQNNYDKSFTYTSPTNQDILVIYYLDSNEVEMTTDTELKTNYTAAAVSTDNQGGSAQVSHYNTEDWAESVQVSRRATGDAKKVTFKATANAGYTFVGWTKNANGTGTVESTDLEFTTTLSGDLTLYANFKRLYTLTVMPLKNTETSATLISAQATLNSTTTDVSFTVDSEPSNTGTASIVEGTTVNLTATAPVATNTYKVVWLDGPTTVKTDTIGAGQSSTSSYSIPNMSAAHNISVQYTQLYRLEVTKTGDGATDSNATVSAEIKDTANNTYELTNGVAYVPAGTTVTVTANVAKGGNPYRVSSEQIGITGKFDLIPTADTAASKTFTQLTINANTTISINFERLYKLTYGLLGESVQVATIAAAAKESGVEDFSPLTASPAYLPNNTTVKFTVTPSGENYTQLYNINSAAQYTYGAVPEQTITADMNVEVRVIQNQTVTIKVPSSDVATLTAKYTFPNAPEQPLNITNTEGNREFKVPQGATVTAKTTIKDSKDKFNGYTVSGSTSYTEDTDNKSVDVEVQNSDITIAPNISIMDVAECPQEILNNTNVSFYAGNKWSGNDTYYYSSSDTTRKHIDTSSKTSGGINYGFVTGTDLKGVPSEAYSLTNDGASDGWGGETMASTAEGGCFYYLNSDSLGSGNRIDKIAATTATTTLSASEVELNAQGVTVTTGSFSSDTTAIGTQFYVQHFIKKSTDTDYTFLGTSQKITATDNTFVTDISKFAKSAGTYEIKTVLTDGKVYYLVGDTKTLNVVEKFDVKVYSATNADLEVKNGSTPLGTISAGADAKTFRVAKGDSISVTATPTPNVGGVYDFTWCVNDAETPYNKKAESTLPLDNITGNKEVKVTLGTHYYELTYSGVTATPDDTYIPANTKVTLTFADSTNHNKVVWKVNGEDEKTSDVVEKGSQDTYEVTMDADKTVSVTKTTLYKLTYSITGADSSTLTSDLSTASADTATVGGSEITKYVTTDVGSVNFTTHRPSGDGFYSVGWAINSAPATYTNSFNSATQTYKDIYQGEADMPITISGDTTVNVTVTKLATTTVTINPESENSVYLTANVSHQDIGAAYDLFTNVTSTDGTYTVPQGTVVTVTSSENAGTGYQPNGFDVTGVTPTSSSVTQVVFTAGSDAIAVTAKATAAVIPTNRIYFKNTVNWSNVYVNFYSDEYWHNNNGTGAQGTFIAAYKMSVYDEANKIYMFELTDELLSCSVVSFTSVGTQSGLENGSKYEYFYGGNDIQVAYRKDFNISMPLYTPDTTVSGTYNSGVKYYNNGTWTAYPETSTETSWYLSGYINGADVEAKNSSFAFTQSSTNANEWTCEYDFSKNDKHYLTFNDGTKYYGVVGGAALAQNTYSAEATELKPEQYYNGKWEISSLSSGDRIKVTLDTSTMKIKWEKVTSGYSINVYVDSGIYNSANVSNYQVRYWGGATTGDATCTDLNTTVTKNVGGTDRTFHKLTASIPSDSKGFKFHIGETWYGDNGDATKKSSVYVYSTTADYE